MGDEKNNTTLDSDALSILARRKCLLAAAALSLAASCETYTEPRQPKTESTATSQPTSQETFQKPTSTIVAPQSEPASTSTQPLTQPTTEPSTAATQSTNIKKPKPKTPPGLCLSPKKPYDICLTIRMEPYKK